MVLRHDAAGVLAVGQASHAWLCGQLARAWGNERFGAVEPLDEVALGAEQHDVGMARWDLAPARHPETGLPKSFMEMGAQANAGLWSRGPERLVTQSRYAALLAIMHGRRLYEGFDLDRASTADAAAVTALKRRAAELEDSLLQTLRGDPVTALYAGAGQLARNSQLVWTWDLMSLALLLDWAPQRLEAVPAADGGAVDIVLDAGAPSGGPDRVHSMDPWPFSAPEVRVHCEGRRLTRGLPDADGLTRALAQAPWETVQFTLVPGAELREGS